jgi:hypothetical protein
MKGLCDRLWEIDASREGRLGAGDAVAFERHLRECVECRTQRDRDRDLRGRARRLLDASPDELALRRVRRRLLRDVALGEPVRKTAPRGWALAGVAVASGLAVFLGVAMTHVPHEELAVKAGVPSSAASAQGAPPLASESFAGSVTPSPGARWWQTRADSIERVRLDDGSVRVHVRPQVTGERFLVALPDGEIEVRGTTFDVSVERGATTRVHVEDGVVELRLAGGGTTRIGVGESVSPAMPPRASTFGGPLRPPRPAAAPLEASARDAAAAHPVVDYAAAIRLLRDGHADRAATAFHALAALEPDASQGEDASFLEALALSRAGRADAAAQVAEHHLVAFPASFHRKEAIILILRDASQRGDCAKARATLGSWDGDPYDPSLRSAFRACADPPR